MPERLAGKAEAFKAGDRVRMLCVRYRGRRALLVRIERLGERAKRPEAPVAFATVHPSSILRAPDATSRQRERELFVDDLRVAAALLGS